MAAVVESGEKLLYGLGTLEELRKRMIGKVVVKQTDMVGENITQTVDLIQNSIESCMILPNMPEAASKLIKEDLDRKYGPTWQCVIGEGYAFHVTVQSGSYLQMYYNGNLSCLVFKT